MSHSHQPIFTIIGKRMNPIHNGSDIWTPDLLLCMCYWLVCVCVRPLTWSWTWVLFLATKDQSGKITLHSCLQCINSDMSCRFVRCYCRVALIWQLIYYSQIVFTNLQNTCTSVWFCRYSLVVENGVVKHVNVEPDGKGLTCSLAPEILQQVWCD